MKNYIWNQSSATLYVYASDNETELRRQTEQIRKHIPPNDLNASLRHSTEVALNLGFSKVGCGEPFKWLKAGMTKYISILLDNRKSLPDSVRLLCDTTPNPLRLNYIVDLKEQLHSTSEELPEHIKQRSDNDHKNPGNSNSNGKDERNSQTIEIDSHKTVNQVMERMNGMKEKLGNKMEEVREEMLSTISQLSSSEKNQKKSKSVEVSSESESGEESEHEVMERMNGMEDKLEKKMKEVREEMLSTIFQLSSSEKNQNKVMERINGMEEKFETTMKAVREEMLSTISQLSSSEKNQKKEEQLNDTPTPAVRKDGQYSVRFEPSKKAMANEVTASPMESIKNEMVRMINIYRRKHNAGDVQREMSLDNSCQKWANHMRDTGSLDQEPNKGRWLNSRSSTDPLDLMSVAKKWVDDWYQTGADYDYNNWNPSSWKTYGRFISIISKSSRQIGFGLSLKKPCLPHQKFHTLYVSMDVSPLTINSRDEVPKNVRPPCTPVVNKANKNNATTSPIKVIRNEVTASPTESLRNEIVRMHNVYRRKHNAGDLQRNTSLDNSAQRWANHLKSTKGGLLHEPNHPRLMHSLSSTVPIDFMSTVQNMMDNFYKEGAAYDYNNWDPTTWKKYGSFTQIIWKKCRQIGIGLSLQEPCLPDNEWYTLYVCLEYDPRGNTMSRDQYLMNVRPP